MSASVACSVLEPKINITHGAYDKCSDLAHPDNGLDASRTFSTAGVCRAILVKAKYHQFCMCLEV